MKRSFRIHSLVAPVLGAAGILVLETAGFAAQEFTLDTANAAAAKGDAKAQYFLGRYYAGINNNGQDYTRAAQYMRQSADQGYAPAQAGLGSFYARGQGVSRDMGQALEWYRKGATQGDPLAEYCLGYAFAHGDGVPKDMDQAIKWWQQSAGQGQVYAQNALGQLYFSGDTPGETNGVNYTLSAKWLLKAAEQDYTGAMNNLAYLYQHGMGVPTDWQQALKWYHRAADRGDAMAQANLGLMYEAGDGVPIDKVEAYKWYSLSAEQGTAEGKHAVKMWNFYHYLTPDQFTEAGQRLAEFHASAATNQPASNP
jgi:hypothetical protein